MSKIYNDHLFLYHDNTISFVCGVDNHKHTPKRFLSFVFGKFIDAVHNCGYPICLTEADFGKFLLRVVTFKTCLLSSDSSN